MENPPSSNETGWPDPFNHSAAVDPEKVESTRNLVALDDTPVMANPTVPIVIVTGDLRSAEPDGSTPRYPFVVT